MADEKLLIVDDDESIRSQMRWAFRGEYEVLEAVDRRSGVETVATGRPEVVILDLGLPPQPSDPSQGLEALYEILKINPVAKVLVVTGYADKKNALRAIELGAFDFFTKPVNLDEVRATLKRAFYIVRLERENMALHKQLEERGLDEMLGTSEPMQEVFETIRKVATVDAPLLILGESGTGKEMAARAVHRLSGRREGPFVAINCGAIPENLLESELFGYEKGAFTGANAMRKGKIEYAHGGTLFLDEIAELGLSLQVKLLRFLQDHTVEHLGGRETIPVDVRIFAATNRDIKKMVEKGDFRDDLFFRLGVITLTMPPLRERGDDVSMMALALLRKFSQVGKGGVREFSKAGLSAIRGYGWPGNCRELENKIKRAVSMTKAGKITPKDLELSAPEPERPKEQPAGLLEARDEFEKEMIRRVLKKHRGVVSRAAKELSISRQYLTGLVSKYGIKPKSK